jgi:hypothetical protein
LADHCGETEATPPKINRKRHPAHFVDNWHGCGLEVLMASGQIRSQKNSDRAAIDAAGNIARVMPWWSKCHEPRFQGVIPS